MGNCKHYEICGLEALEDEDEELCILHSQAPNKDKNKFNKALEDHRGGGGCDFSLFLFPDEVNFDDVLFRYKANFSGVTFGQRAKFRHVTFLDDANFYGASFRNEANFSDATFNKDTDFRGASFDKLANFSEAIFCGEANFSGIKCTQSALFENAMVDFVFSKCIFRGHTNFNDAVFKNKAHFWEVKFQGKVEFEKTNFLGEVDFRFSDFSSRSDFHRATFQAYADFGFAEFNRDVSFDNSNFRKRAKFLGAVFSMKANFRGVKFTMSVNFGHATFNGGVDFSFASFSEKCVFYRASFMKVTRFINCTFAEMVNFTEATFKDTAIFVARDEKADAPRIFAGVKVDFRWVLIDPSCLITMRNADLRKCRFFGTNLRRIDVVGAKWPQTGDNRFAVYDEIAPLKEAEVLSWDGIEELYRQLKQNFEDRRDYERAGDFHRSEKEMRRRHPEIEGTWRIPLEVYKWLSGYGENYLLPLVWAFVLFICSTVGYLSLGLFSTRMDRELVWGSLSDLLTAGLYSLRVMFFLKPLDLYPVDCRGTLLLTIESLLGPLLIGFFALALRQRLKR